MAEKSKKNYKLTDILYSADICLKLKISNSTLKRMEKKGLPFFRNEHSNRKMYIGDEVMEWVCKDK